MVSRVRLYLLLIVILLFFYGCILNLPTIHEGATTTPGQERAAINHIENGKKHLKRGKCKQAIKQFEKAVERDPRNSEANYWLGASHYRCGYYSRARNYWYIVIEVRAKDTAWLSRVRTAIGFTFELEGNRSRAYSEYNLALKFDPGNSVAKIGIGSLEGAIKTGKGKGKGKGKQHRASSPFRREIDALIFLGL